MKRIISISLLSSLSLMMISCSTDKNFEAQLKNAIIKNPEILMEVIEQNPGRFMETVQKAAVASKNDLAKSRQKSEAQKIDEAIANPLKPFIRPDDIVRGDINAPITLVEYSDFECPFCKREFETVKALLDKYPGKIKFVYKHLPLSFHKSAKLSAEYYEALRLENPKIAIKFHDLIFDSQRQLSNGEPFLKKMAKNAGGNMALLKTNLKSKIIQIRIEEDIKGAQKFGIQGTPGFIINGVPVKGAYPPDHFVRIINKLKALGKLKI